jgi:hypothetical protein
MFLLRLRHASRLVDRPPLVWAGWCGAALSDSAGLGTEVVFLVVEVIVVEGVVVEGVVVEMVVVDENVVNDEVGGG